MSELITGVLTGLALVAVALMPSLEMIRGML
jgi:hypothetical protein